MESLGRGTHPKVDFAERSLTLCWKGQEGKSLCITACAAEQTPKSAIGAHSMQRICLQVQCKYLCNSCGWRRTDWLRHGVTEVLPEHTPWKMSLSWIWILLWPPKLIVLPDKWLALFALLGATIKVPKCKAFIYQDVVYNVSCASITLFSNLPGSPQNSEAIQGQTDKMEERHNNWGSMALPTVFCKQITAAYS